MGVAAVVGVLGVLPGRLLLLVAAHRTLTYLPLLGCPAHPQAARPPPDCPPANALQEPMDFSTIGARLAGGRFYITLDQFVADVGRIFSNCRYAECVREGCIYGQSTCCRCCCRNEA